MKQPFTIGVTTMPDATTTVNGDEIDPETGEVLNQHNVRPEQPITNPDELTAFLKRVRAIEHDADDHKRVKAAEESSRKKLAGVAEWLLAKREQDILAVAQAVFAAPKGLAGMKPKTWVTGPFTLALQDIPDAFDVTDADALMAYCEECAADLIRISVQFSKDAYDQLDQPPVNLLPFGILMWMLTRSASQAIEDNVTISFTPDTAAFLARLAYHGIVPEDDGGWAEQIIIDTQTGKRVDAFVHCTPGVKNGKVKYTSPTAATEGSE